MDFEYRQRIVTGDIALDSDIRAIDAAAAGSKISLIAGGGGNELVS